MQLSDVSEPGNTCMVLTSECFGNFCASCAASLVIAYISMPHRHTWGTDLTVPHEFAACHLHITMET